jgi:ABC-type xylose transport system permease subunit
MGIIGNIQNNIVAIYEIKSFYITLAGGNFFQIIYIGQITILPIVKN